MLLAQAASRRRDGEGQSERGRAVLAASPAPNQSLDRVINNSLVKDSCNEK